MIALIIDPIGAIRGGGQQYSAHLADTLADSGCEVYLPAIHGLSAVEHLREGTAVTADFPKQQDLDLFIVSEPLGYEEAEEVRKCFNSKREVFVCYFYSPAVPREWVRSFDAVMTLCTEHALAMRRKWGISPAVIPAGIEPIDFKPERKRETVISFGRLEEAKGHYLAATTARFHLSNWAVRVGGYRSNDQLVEKLRYIGAEVLVDMTQGEKVNFLQEASIGLFLRGLRPYGRADVDREGWGIGLAEAMSAGVVPVAFAGGGHLDIITDGSGFLVSNAEELEDALMKLKDESLRGAMAAAAAARAREFVAGPLLKQAATFVRGEL